jgi:hypothetical protein
MLIDCDGCAVRGEACGGCLVSALFEPPDEVAGLTGDERRAIEVFEMAGFEVEVISAPAPASAPAPPPAPPSAPLRLTPRTRRPRHVA